MTRVRFAPSPTGTLHVGNALSAVANRRFGDWLLLRIDDTDQARNLPGGEEGVIGDLTWLGVSWDEGPVRQSSRAARHLEAARAAGLPQRFEGVMLWRNDGSGKLTFDPNALSAGAYVNCVVHDDPAAYVTVAQAVAPGAKARSADATVSEVTVKSKYPVDHRRFGPKR